MTTDSLSIPIGDAGLDITDNENFSYVLGDLTAYTEYSFNLSSVYGANTSSAVSASGNTSEGSKLYSCMPIHNTLDTYARFLVVLLLYLGIYTGLFIDCLIV